LTDWERIRRPGGTPAGGQFAPHSHPEPEIQLDPDDIPQRALLGMTQRQFSEWLDESVKGSYSFPPKPIHPVQIGYFWSNVEIPDRVLRRFRQTWPYARKRTLDEWATTELEESGFPRPVKEGVFGGKRYKQELAEWESKWWAARGELEQRHAPEAVSDYDVRRMVTRCQMYLAVQDLKDEALVNWCMGNSTSVLDPADDDPMPVQHIESYYYLCDDELRRSLIDIDPTEQMGEKLDSISTSINSMSEHIKTIEDAQNLDFATRGARDEREFTKMAENAGYERYR